MKNNLYVLYNKLSKRYGDVMAFSSDDWAIHNVQSVVEKSEDGKIDYLELCRVGEIDVETGVVTPEPPVRIAWRMQVPPLPLTPPQTEEDVNK